jgi:hypothetical protein
VVAVADGSGRDAVPERWTAGAGMWMDMTLDPRFAAWTAPEGERATLLAYLRRYRLTMEMKCADLDAAQLASRSVAAFYDVPARPYPSHGRGGTSLVPAG